MIEEWKPVVNYNGIFRNKYSISNFGEVKNNKGEIIKPYTNEYGYDFLILHNCFVSHNIKIHQLVTEAFLGKKPKGYDVDHIDGNKHNNRVDNLRYISHKANVKKSCDKPILQYTLNGEFINRYNSITEASKAIGVVKTAICNCLNGRSRSCKNYIWRYEVVS